MADTGAWVWSRRPGHRELRHAFDVALVDGDILHYDEGFDRIAEIAGQPTRWLADRGAL